MSQDLLSFRKVGKESERLAEENRELRNMLQELKVEGAQKDLKIREIELEKYKISQPLQDQIRTLEDSHARELIQSKTAYQQQIKRLKEKLEGQSKNKIEGLSKQSEELKSQLQSQRDELKKSSQIQMSILRSKLESERQQMRSQLQNEKNKAFASMQNREREVTLASKQQIQTFRKQYETEIANLKTTTGNEIENLNAALASEKQVAKTKYDNLRTTLDEQISAETKKLMDKYEKEKGHLRGSFIDEKAEMEDMLQTRNEEMKRKISQFNEEKAKLIASHEVEADRLKKTIEGLEKKISQDKQLIENLQGQNFQLNSHVSSYDKSLGFYKEEIEHFDQFIEKNNSHLVQQFKCLDDIYSQPSLEKIKLTQLMTKQYRELVQAIKHPVMVKIINQKEAIINNYIGDQMITFLKAVEDIDVTDVYSIHSEKGKCFKRVIQNITLFKSIESQNINDTVDMYFNKKLLEKIKVVLAKYAKAIVSRNNEKGQLEFIKLGHQYYEMKDFLSNQIPEHEDFCQEQYREIDTSMAVGFKRFEQAYMLVGNSKTVEKLQDYINRAEHLKKFVIVMHAVKNHRKYAYHLEGALGLKMQDVKAVMLGTLSDYKKELKQKVDELLQTRIYYDCFLYQKIYKKLRVFDDILTKEENSYHNFNFTELYNKIVNATKIIKDQKINMASIIITEDKISTDPLQREYAAIAFDNSLMALYRQRLTTVLHSRTLNINRINENSLITSKTTEKFENYYIQSKNLCEINEFKEAEEVIEHAKLYPTKIPILASSLQPKFKQYYYATGEFKNLAESNTKIKSALDFQLFLQRQFKEHHIAFKEKILETRYSKLPLPENEEQCAFHMLLRLNESNLNKLNTVINDPEETLSDEHYEYFTNMTSSLSKYQSGKIQEKLQTTIQSTIGQLEAKEWLEGDLNSAVERKMMAKINKLSNKDIALYRDLFNIHKNKVIEERQRIMSSEKRILKEEQFNKLKEFVDQCQKHEAAGSKFNKIYINILDEHIAYIYENLDDNDKKCRFVENIYKLNLVSATKSVREIFKTKEHAAFFSKPDLVFINDNVQLIENFEGQTEVDISKAVHQIANTFKLYSILKANTGKSLLDDEQQQKIQQQIASIRYNVTKSYLNLCRNVEHENPFDQNCKKRQVFLNYIKIQIFLRLMKKVQTINPEQGYYEIADEYTKIMARCKNFIEKIFQEIKKFRFIKEDLVDDYNQREKLLAHLGRIQRYIEVFKEIKYELVKLEDYTKNNYLQQLPLSRFDYKDIVLIIQMTWIKEYAVVKKEIAEMFSDNRWEVTNKYKLLLAEKELVKDQNLLYFNEFIKEQYDFKKTVIEELMLIDSKCQRYVQEVQKENQFYTTHIGKLEENRNNYINKEKERIKNKYSRLIAEVRNSFHEITSEKARQKKIESEINTLKNQQRTEEEKLLDYQTKNIENCRVKANIKLKRWISKIFYINSIVDNVQQSFDRAIEQLCQRILFKMNQQMQKQDKNIKNEYFAQDIRLSKQASSLGVINISQLKSKHIIQAKSEIGNNQLMVASEVNDENSETMELRSRSRVTDQNYQQKSMIHIDASEEEEEIKVKVGASRPNIQKVGVPQPKIEKAPQPIIQTAQQEKRVQKPKQYTVNVHQIQKPQPSPQQNKPNSLIKKILDGCPQLRSNQSARNRLNANYDEYVKQLQKVEKQYNQHQSESKLMKLVNETKQSVKELKPPILMARIFAVHSIFQSIAEQSDVSEGNPHETQALAALLLVGPQSQGKAVANRLVELEPGEGKSRVVAGVNCFMALQGNQVYCAAFSQDLCQRDKKQYQKLYQSFGLGEMIKYGSFYQHCSAVVDEDQNMMQISKKILVGLEITSDQQEYVDKLARLSQPNSKSNKVLVLDEVDTLFALPYGQVYVPSIILQSNEVKNMIKFIWANRNNDKLGKIVKNSQQYTALMTKNPKISQLLENQVEIMTKSWNNYKNSSYQVQANDLVIKKQEKEPNFGSVFAACFEYDNKKISQKNYQKHLVINLKLGQASYAQLPKHFDSILGVGATISSLSESQSQALKQQYGIKQIYHLPSKFDKENRKIFGARSCKKDQFAKILMKSVHAIKKTGRPTIIVFQTEDELSSFAEISDLAQYSADICKISESSSSQTRSSLISYAGSRGRITLTTYVVARGADFMVYDSQISEKGGVHVIQAYVPSKQEEFIQVYGRAARQGKAGSYEMIATLQMLAKKQIKKVDDDELLENLNEYWKASSQKSSLQAQKLRQAAKSQHDKMLKVFGNLNSREKLYQSVLKWNYVETNSDIIRTIIAIDGTGTVAGPMGLAIKASQEMIKQAIDRIDEIIKQKNRKCSYEHKIIIFRNYSSKYEKLIEQSKFSKDGNQLQAFMTTIKAEGGLRNEAHEALFYEIGRLCASERVDQIILIGDAGANKYEEIVKYRKKFSGEAYWSSKIPLLPKAENYLEPILQRQIPIHSMYILKNRPDSAESDKNVKLYFENLSQKHRGLCKQLSVAEKEKAMSQLTNFIAERVLTQIGRDLVEVYVQKYSK